MRIAVNVEIVFTPRAEDMEKKHEGDAEIDFLRRAFDGTIRPELNAMQKTTGCNWTILENRFVDA